MKFHHSALLEAIDAAHLVESAGFVTRNIGLLLESRGPAGAAVGEMCRIEMPQGSASLLAQVIGLNEDRLVLLPFARMHGLQSGSRVVALRRPLSVPVGDALLGRVVDAFCRPLDGAAAPRGRERPVRADPAAPLSRRRIGTVLETGVRAIDGLLTLGDGQRIAILAGSGVGKSTLLGMLVRNSAADVVVVGLIGERGREVLEFIEETLGGQGLARAVVIVATADEPPLVRETATLTAMTVAEHFRDQGKSVLLIVDSLTRYAMARRDVGLAVGEPATARGYTPSVFSEMACLLERCGPVRGAGSITGVFTVLVEGDDIHDPIADSVRGIVDGHIVLSRELANRGHFPSIDLIASVSRLASGLADTRERALASTARKVLSVLHSAKDVLELGVYRAGSNPELDQALVKQPLLNDLFRQAVDERTSRKDTMNLLAQALAGDGR
ncbi:FliI/YscN family ATPase [Paludibacterium paludis]|uniref:EscN/YscN/HrcN family type III secretion system ATPase n=1 Tax=Paludibacterium paludis TaxID=1225769 RepID=A0A918P761_9NEIS|nr:FliI/YscN family ATPase [Paludibacterium paludis]GGY28858.1 EscN/YscN/HrcN family type III secretion system ATPase [Paludibacterium paludis]